MTRTSTSKCNTVFYFLQIFVKNLKRNEKKKEANSALYSVVVFFSNG